MRSPPAVQCLERTLVRHGRRPGVFLAALGAGMCLVIAAAAASTGGPTFRSQLFFGAIVDSAGDLAIGDVNNDGRPDLVTANYYPDGGISVDLNQGRGNFDAHSYAVADPSARSVALAELNGDGKVDVIVSTEDDSEKPTGVSTFLNKGDGTFRHGPVTALAPMAFGAAGDLTGDGKADLVVVDAKGAAIGVFLNRGGGGFDAGPEQYATGKGVSAVAVADVNRDGKADVATANWASGTASVLLNSGNGSLEAKQDYRTGRQPAAIKLQDLNGDRQPDLVTANRTTVSVLLNRGDGRFAVRRDYETGSCSPSALAIGDLNGDRKADIATDCVTVFVNNGDGTFRPRLDYDYQFEPLSLAIADLTGDHRRDVIVLVHNERNGDNWLAVLVNTPGVCNVQALAGLTLLDAKRSLARVNCRIGKVSRASSKRVKKGRVISQKPTFGAVRPGGTKVDVVVSSGPA
jgi:hypothetical protein